MATNILKGLNKGQRHKLTDDNLKIIIKRSNITLDNIQFFRLRDALTAINSHNINTTRNAYIGQIEKLRISNLHRKNRCAEFYSLKLFLMTKYKNIFEEWLSNKKADVEDSIRK